jgi:rhodanese-related sulfurtransferase
LQVTTFEFIKQNALLIGLAAGSGIALLWPMLTGGGAAGVANISPTEAVLLLNRNKPLILDVRDATEFAAGHIQGARNIPVAELAGRIKEIEKFKDKPVLVHCQKGLRAKTACGILRAQQFSQLHNLQGGLDSWVEAKMPLVKTSATKG